MLGIAAVAVLGQAFLLPKIQVIAIKQAMERSERTPFGRAMKPNGVAVGFPAPGHCQRWARQEKRCYIRR
jgi:hypothetical protein